MATYIIKGGPRRDQVSLALFARKESNQIVTFTAQEIVRGAKPETITVRVVSVARHNVPNSWLIRGETVLNGEKRQVTCRYCTTPKEGQIVTF